AAAALDARRPDGACHRTRRRPHGDVGMTSRDPQAGPSAVTAMHEATAEQAVRRRRGARAFVVLAGLALAVAGTIAVYAFLTAGEESTDDATVEADVVAVTSRVGGVVAKVLVHDNQPVAKGDPLLELDPADFAARLDQAMAELDTARAQAAGADAQEQVVRASATGGLRSAKAQVAASSSAVESAGAEIAAARAAVTRAQAEV